MALRPLRSDAAREAPIANALIDARAASISRLACLQGIDLATWVASPHERFPATGRIDADVLAGLDLAAAAQRYLREADAYGTDDTAATSRVAMARAGIDRDLLPDVAALQRSGVDPARHRLAPDGATTLVESGASLKLRGIDRVEDTLDRFVEDIERVTGTQSGGLLYLSGPDAQGWGAHYDRHDGLVIQAVGSKRWRVFEPVESAPLRPWTEYRVTDRVAWEGVLQEGDVLLVPRGWGHHVEGTHEGSLHLTVPIRLPSGADVLSTAAQRHRGAAAGHVEVSSTALPVDHVLDVLGDPSAVDACLWRHRAGIAARGISRPRAVAAWVAALAGGAPPADPVRLAVPGGVFMDDERWIVAAGTGVEATEVLLRVVVRLLQGPAGWDETAQVGPGANAVVLQLLEAGLAHTVAAEPGPSWRHSDELDALDWLLARHDVAGASIVEPDGTQRPPLVARRREPSAPLTLDPVALARDLAAGCTLRVPELDERTALVTSDRDGRWHVELVEGPG